MQDRVPQARLYKVWNVPEWGSADGDYLGLAGVRAQHRQVLPAVQAAGLRRADRDRRERFRRPARDRRALHHRGGRPPGRRPAPGSSGRSTRSWPGCSPPARRRWSCSARRRRRVPGSFAGWSGSAGSAGKSDVLAKGEVFAGRPDYYKTQLARIAAATAAQVRGAAARWLSDGVYTLEVRPFPEYAVAPVRGRPVRAARSRARRRTRNSPRSSATRSPTASRSSWPNAGRFRWCGSTCCSTRASRRTSSPSRARPASR